MKRHVKFKDNKGNIFNVDIKIKDGRFSISTDWGGGCGQCLDSISPKNEYQKKLIELWHKWHLNDMHAGTEEQEKAIENWKKQGNKYDYEKACEYLKSINMYEVKHPETGENYKYAHGWLKRELPANIEKEINDLCNNIEEIEEEEEKGEILVKDVFDDLKNLTEEEIKEKYPPEFDIEEYEEEIIALALHLELTIDELEDIEESGNNTYIHGGIYYYVGEYEELEEIARDYLTQDDYLWKSAVEADRTTKGLDEWAEEVINMDGVGHILNGWDGSSYEEKVNGTYYTICRQ